MSIKFDKKNINKSISSYKFVTGFTLIELMISIFLIVSIGTVILTVFTSTLRGTKKASVVSKVRESGNFAISQMVRNIQYSQINGTCDENETLSSLSLTTQDGDILTYSCLDSSSDPEPGNISSASATRINYLIDTTTAKLRDGSCSFTCYNSGPTVPQRVRISFILDDASSSEFAEDIVSIPFSTSVVLRNFGQ